MSTNVRAGARLTPAIHRLLAAPCHAPVLALGGSARLRKLAETTQHLAEQAETALLSEAIRPVVTGSAIGELATATGPGAVAALADVRARLAAPGSLLTADAVALLHALSATAARVERTVLADIVATTLREDLGAVTVHRADGAHVTGVEARFADGGCLLVAVEPGSIVTDQADAIGLCASRQQALELGLSSRGVAVQPNGRDQHEQVIGPLIATAARQSAPTLADAVAAFAVPSIEAGASTAGMTRSRAMTKRARTATRRPQETAP